MNDPHVVALCYTIGHDGSVDYGQAKPRNDEADNFSVRIEDGKVRFTMKPHTHYSTEAEALEAVREYIERWEFAAGLERGLGTFKLVYQKPDIVDRRPSPDGFAELSDEISLGPLKVSEEPTSLIQYPKPPPADLLISPDVQSMYDRFIGYRLGREPLPAMAYFCLTVLEKSTGAQQDTRNAAAKQYEIDKGVLNEVGKLSTEKGGSQARKVDGIGDELTPSETHFLEKAIAALIRRAAEVAHDPNKSRDTIKLSDLPVLV